MRLFHAFCTIAVSTRRSPENYLTGTEITRGFYDVKPGFAIASHLKTT
jgi:hypothetical protein